MDSRIARLKAFADHKAEHGTTNTALALQLGISQGKLSKILCGRLGMSLDTALEIERLTDGWAGGQILASEWKGYEPHRKTRAAESKQSSAVDPTAATERPPAAIKNRTPRAARA